MVFVLFDFLDALDKFKTCLNQPNFRIKVDSIFLNFIELKNVKSHVDHESDFINSHFEKRVSKLEHNGSKLILKKYFP